MKAVEDIHMFYEHNMVSDIRAVLEDEWGMEIINYPKADVVFKHVLFDFDGTLSLIREGWRGIMIPYFVEVLLDTPKAESKEAIDEEVTLFVDRLTGKQTIFQCIKLDGEVVKRGGVKNEPGVYKAEYLRRLGVHIENRIKDLTENNNKAHEYMVPGGVELLELLRDKGCTLYLASGTDEIDVQNEARLLGLDKFFGEHIYGAVDAMTDCSKEAVIKEIISKNNLTGAELLSFGDGYVEIELVSDVGGYSVGVATDEVRRKGVNPVKRERLLEGGADLIIPDFAEPQELIAFLFH